MNEFVMLKGNIHAAKNNITENDWFNHCSEKQIPFVRINKKGAKSDIHWDYITINTDNDGAVIENEHLFSYLLGIYHVVADLNSSYEMSPQVGTFFNIPSELSERTAKAIYAGIVMEIKEFAKQKSISKFNAQSGSRGPLTSTPQHPAEN